MGRDIVSVRIDSMLRSSSSSSYNPKIYEVDQNLRQVNEKAYDPGLVAIGPIHRNKDHLKAMEHLKVSYLHQFLQRRNETVDVYVVKLRELEERARNCYSNFIHLPDTDKFVEMLLLDGFFVVVLLLKLHFKDWQDKNEYILHSTQVHKRVAADLLLVENQLPFFILSQLFDMTKSSHPDDNLSFLVLRRLCWVLPWNWNQHAHRFALLQDQNHVESVAPLQDQSHVDIAPLQDHNHVDVAPLPDQNQADIAPIQDQSHVDIAPLQDRNDVDFFRLQDRNDVDYDHLLGMVYGAYFPRSANVPKNRKGFETISTVSELDDVGISFKKVKEGVHVMDKGANVMDVRFTSDKVIQLSHLTVEDYTETILRNFIAYEQMQPDNVQRYVSDYTILMTYLVNSSKDVEILRRAGIFEHMLGDDETVHQMFNKLGRHVIINRNHFCYTEVSECAEEHCRHRHNRWMAILRRDYFYSPWAILSFIAAVILLLLTTTQTVFTIRPSGL